MTLHGGTIKNNICKQQVITTLHGGTLKNNTSISRYASMKKKQITSCDYYMQISPCYKLD